MTLVIKKKTKTGLFTNRWAIGGYVLPQNQDAPSHYFQKRCVSAPLTKAGDQTQKKQYLQTLTITPLFSKGFEIRFRDKL